MLTGPDRQRLRSLRDRRREHRQADEQLTVDERALILELRTRSDPEPALLRELADELGVHVSRVEQIERAARGTD